MDKDPQVTFEVPDDTATLIIAAEVVPVVGEQGMRLLRSLIGSARELDSERTLSASLRRDASARNSRIDEMDSELKAAHASVEDFSSSLRTLTFALEEATRRVDEDARRHKKAEQELNELKRKNSSIWWTLKHVGWLILRKLHITRAK